MCGVTCQSRALEDSQDCHVRPKEYHGVLAQRGTVRNGRAWEVHEIIRARHRGGDTTGQSCDDVREQAMCTTHDSRNLKLHGEDARRPSRWRLSAKRCWRDPRTPPPSGRRRDDARRRGTRAASIAHNGDATCDKREPRSAVGVPFDVAQRGSPAPPPTIRGWPGCRSRHTARRARRASRRAPRRRPRTPRASRPRA